MRHGIQLGHTELLKDDRAGYATVIQKINEIIKCLKEEEKSSWCDPEFGPTEEDEELTANEKISLLSHGTPKLKES